MARRVMQKPDRDGWTFPVGFSKASAEPWELCPTCSPYSPTYHGRKKRRTYADETIRRMEVMPGLERMPTERKSRFMRRIKQAGLGLSLINADWCGNGCSRPSPEYVWDRHCELTRHVYYQPGDREYGSFIKYHKVLVARVRTIADLDNALKEWE